MDVRTDTTVGVLGGTGPGGAGVALRMAAAGCEVVVGSRDPGRAAEVVAELVEPWPDVGGLVRGATNEEAASCDVVVMASPWEPALVLAEQHAEALEGRTVITMVNALIRSGAAFLPLTMPRGSVAAELQARLPGSNVVGAFHHMPAKQFADLSYVFDCDVLVFGDDRDARAEVHGLITGMDGLRPVTVGTLELAGAVEALTAVLIQANVIHRTHSTLRLIGDFG